MELQDGENAHPSWKNDPLWNTEIKDSSSVYMPDLLKIWSININMQKLGEDSTLRFLDAPIFIKDALEPLQVNLTINYYDGYGKDSFFIGPDFREEEFEEVKSRLFSAVNDMIAWKMFDDSGNYDKTIKGTKLEKRLIKLAKALGVIE